MSVFALFEIDNNIYEIIAFTDTANRKKGYFKALLNYLYTDLKTGTELSFICERNYSRLPSKYYESSDVLNF